MRSLSTKADKAPLKWGVNGLVYQVSTRDTTCLSQLRLVFGPWLTEHNIDPLSCWNVNCSSDEWTVQSNDKVSVFKTLSDAVRAVEFGAIVNCFESCLHLTLHGALVSSRGRGVLIVGPGESGKSTLACALWQANYSFLCDDTTLIDTKHLRAYSTPRRVSVRHGSRTLLGDRLWSRIAATPSCDQRQKGVLFHTHEVDQQSHPCSTPLSLVIVLGRRSVSLDPGTSKRIEPTDALMALLPHSNLARQLGAGEAILGIGPIADAVPAYDLSRGSLAQMAECVEHLLVETECNLDP